MIDIKWPIEHIPISPGFLIADLLNGLHRLVQKKMPFAVIVCVILACQTWAKRYSAAMLREEAYKEVRRS